MEEGPRQVSDKSKSDERGSRKLPVGYPYWLVITRIGRLAKQVPPQYRGTHIERDLKSGRIGGKRIQEEKFASLSRAMLDYTRRAELEGKEVEVYRVDRPRSRRVRVVGWKMELYRATR